MANTHSFVIRTLANYTDDALNCAGVCAANDLDNGQFVTRGALALASGDGGYEFAVSLPSANAVDLWLVESPIVGSTVEMQAMDDPRYFYTPAGVPCSIKGIRANFDFIEVPASAFATSYDPDTVGSSAAYASVNTSGRLVAVANAPANGTYFSIEATHSVDVGGEIVKTWVLKCAKN